MNDPDLGRLLDRLAQSAPPPPDGNSLRRRWRRRQMRRAALAGSLVLVAGWLLLLNHTQYPPTVTTPVVVIRPLIVPPTMPLPLDPASPELVADITACLGLSPDAAVQLRKNDGGLQVAGSTRVPLSRLRTLEPLLGRIAILDLRFSPGTKPRIRLLITNA